MLRPMRLRGNCEPPQAMCLLDLLDVDQARPKYVRTLPCHAEIARRAVLACLEVAADNVAIRPIRATVCGVRSIFSNGPAGLPPDSRIRPAMPTLRSLSRSR